MVRLDKTFELKTIRVQRRLPNAACTKHYIGWRILEVWEFGYADLLLTIYRVHTVVIFLNYLIRRSSSVILKDQKGHIAAESIVNISRRICHCTCHKMLASISAFRLQILSIYAHGRMNHPPRKQTGKLIPYTLMIDPPGENSRAKDWPLGQPALAWAVQMKSHHRLQNICAALLSLVWYWLIVANTWTLCQHNINLQ
jgi:hypothetical protein